MIDLNKDEDMLEFEESEKEREIKREIHKLKEAMRYEKQLQRSKKRRICDIKLQMIVLIKRERKKREREVGKAENTWCVVQRQKNCWRVKKVLKC